MSTDSSNNSISDMTSTLPGTIPSTSIGNNLKIVRLQDHQLMQQQVLLHQLRIRQHQKLALNENQIKTPSQYGLDRADSGSEDNEMRKNEYSTTKSNCKNEPRAIASTEVKQKLQGFLLKKKEREAVALASSTTSIPNKVHNWSTNRQNDANNYSLPFVAQQLLKRHEEEYPLRKTASEPLLAKMRLKERVIQRRYAPIARHKDRFVIKMSPLAKTSSNSDSGTNSPPGLVALCQSSTSSDSGINVGSGNFRVNASRKDAHRRDVSCRTSNLVRNEEKPVDLSSSSSQLHAPSISRGIPMYDTAQAYTSHRHKSVGRTRSAPLPIDHSYFNPNASQPSNLSVHYEESEQNQTNLNMNSSYAIKQQIRQNVLVRSRLSQTSRNNENNSQAIDLSASSYDSVATTNAASGVACNNTQGSHMIRPIVNRAFSNPLAGLHMDPSQPLNLTVSTKYIPTMLGNYGKPTTGLAYDNVMLKHSCICGDNSNHLEHSGRLQSVWARLVETGLVHQCARLRPRTATLEEIQTCHGEEHSLYFATNPLSRQKMDPTKLVNLPTKNLVTLPCGGLGIDTDTVWNDLHTAPAARMAVGCVTDLAFKTATGDIRNGFAVVRPPGHHAEHSQSMGFCYFNSVAIAAKLLQLKLGFRRILIVDWDVHHGNGTQEMFYDNKRVLFISLHRFDDGQFFPGTGSSSECGCGAGVGFNVNIAWGGELNPPMGDAEYIAAFRTIVMPIAKDFLPDIILVSAGFDAADGHSPQLGGYKVSPACFAFMTQQLSQLSGGKIVLALEGGYDLPAICDCSEECVRALLGFSCTPVSEEELRRPPCQNAIETLGQTIQQQVKYWPVLQRLAHTVHFSAVDANYFCEENEAVTAMAMLSMNRCARKAPPPVMDSSEPMEDSDNCW